MKISACLIVKNEEKYLDRCLKSIYKYVDEIIITDTGSTDKTIEIAKKYTDKIYFLKWSDDFAAARNFCQSHAAGEYILRIDADEYFLEEDIIQLVKTVQSAQPFDSLDITLNHCNNTNIIHSTKILVVFANYLKWTWKLHEILDIQPNTINLFCENIFLQHDQNINSKSHNDINYLEKIFATDTKNITIFCLLIHHYLYENNFNKINFTINKLWYIRYNFMKDIICIIKTFINRF